MTRLADRTLGQLAVDVARPAYNRALVRTGVVHLGLGAFHRAHQAPVFEAALDDGDLRWGVHGIAMRSAGLAATLVAQDGLYTLAERDGADTRLRIVGALAAITVAAQDPARVIAALAAADTHLVTLTVTEKGYAVPPADVAESMAGLLAAGLDRRRRAGGRPLSVLSCDNLAHNGAVARAATLDAADRLGLGAATLRWIADEVAFPATMVDRITPAATPALADEIAARIALRDEAPVATERFTQWVIEDRFAGPRPDFAAYGVELAADVAPWEAVKLRLLNAAHSTLAYLGRLDGDRFVHQVIAKPAFAALIRRLWDEAVTTLTLPTGLDPAAYRRSLERRFADPSLAHATDQIATDGSAKLPVRIIATLAERRARGLDSPALALAIGGWALALAGRDDAGNTLDLVDPLAATLKPIAKADNLPEAIVAALLAAIGITPAVVAAMAPECGVALARVRHGAHAAAASLQTAR